AASRACCRENQHPEPPRTAPCPVGSAFAGRGRKPAVHLAARLAGPGACAHTTAPAGEWSATRSTAGPRMGNSARASGYTAPGLACFAVQQAAPTIPCETARNWLAHRQAEETAPDLGRTNPESLPD